MKAITKNEWVEEVLEMLRKSERRHMVSKACGMITPEEHGELNLARAEIRQALLKLEGK